jgi:hypothetical protein
VRPRRGPTGNRMGRAPSAPDRPPLTSAPPGRSRRPRAVDRRARRSSNSPARPPAAGRLPSGVSDTLRRRRSRRAPGLVWRSSSNTLARPRRGAELALRTGRAVDDGLDRRLLPRRSPTRAGRARREPGLRPHSTRRFSAGLRRAVVSGPVWPPRPHQGEVRTVVLGGQPEALTASRPERLGPPASARRAVWTRRSCRRGLAART